MIINIPPWIVTQCSEFATACAATNKYYASRGQSNLNKITNDIMVGKLGEWACHKMLLDKGFKVSEPDMQIHLGRKKSHSPDLSTSTINFSVKTQTLRSVEDYGMSWLMEKSSLAKFKGHQVILCIYLGEAKVLIQNIVPFERLLAVQAAPKLAYLITKVAFYYQDLLCDSLLTLK